MNPYTTSKRWLRLFSVLGLLIVLALTACVPQPDADTPSGPDETPVAPDTPSQTEEPSNAPGQGGAAPADVAESNVPRDMSPDVSPEDLKALAEGNNAFALALFDALVTDSENTFFSPYSISVALAMTYAGARGETAAQMADVLHFTLPDARLHPAFNALDLALQPEIPEGIDDFEPLELHIANSLWGERQYSFLTEFLDLLARNYGAGMRLVDFRGDAEGARKTINAWVADHTEERIQDLLKPGIVGPDTRLVLVNAIYFNGGWLFTFEEDLTQAREFTRLDGSQVSVPMMRWSESNGAPYLKGDGFRAVELAYEGGNAAMLLIVPDAGAFETFRKGFDAEQLAAIVEKLEQETVALTLPKFSSESEINLSKVLQQMGMVDAFVGGQADFSGMDGTRNLAISEVVHKANIDVDEAGTEAAAATAVVMRETAMMIDDV
ncbi:MAG: serpin family protein, partial [Anaerolineae bacterium]|nr:serpin family protein [Anaerolineae bacterium]